MLNWFESKDGKCGMGVVREGVASGVRSSFPLACVFGALSLVMAMPSAVAADARAAVRAGSFAATGPAVKRADGASSTPRGTGLVSYSTLEQFKAALADPGTLVGEDFEGGFNTPYAFNFCMDPMSAEEDDGCFSPGQLVDGFSLGSSSAAGMVILGEGFLGQVGTVVVAADPSADIVVQFPDTRTAVALNVAAYSDFGPNSLASGPVVVVAFDEQGDEIGRVLVPMVSESANFVGITSGLPMAKVTLSTVEPWLKAVNDLWFTDVDGGGSNGVHASGLLNHHVPDASDGSSLNFTSVAVADVAPGSDDWDVHLSIQDGALQFHSLPLYDVRWVLDSGAVAALQPGDVVGPASTFQGSPGTADAAAAWLAGADAYAGFRFDCDGRLYNAVAGGRCYGYLHLYTESASGVPVTIVEYVYDGDGQPITILQGSATDPVSRVTPQRAAVLLYPGTSTTTPLQIDNLGARSLSFDFSESVPSGTDPRPHGGPAPGTIDISQMSHQMPSFNSGISCISAGTLDMSWWRRFYFNEHPVVEPSSTIHSVTIGVEAGPPTPVTINVYRIPHSVPPNVIPYDQLELVGQGTAVVEGDMSLWTIPIAPGATISDTSKYDMVVEYHIDGSDGAFYPGANPSPQTHSSFLSSNDPACLFGEDGYPSNGDSSFPGFHLIMSVNVDGHPLQDNCDDPQDVPWLAIDPLYGLVAGGSTLDAEVGVDSTGLAVGRYSANLCMASNDPATPLQVVPVDLTVAADIPVLSATPSPIFVTLQEGDSASQDLTVRNAGGGTLNYQILEQSAAVAPTSFRTAANDASNRGRATFAQNPRASEGLSGGAMPLLDASISQMLDNTPGDYGVSCPPDGSTPSDTSWWRRFYFNEYAGLGSVVNVNSVTISSGSDGPDGQPLTINLYRIPHSTPIDTIPTAALTLIGSATGFIDSGLVTVTIPVSGSIEDTAEDDLVVEWHMDGTDVAFYPGANLSPESHPTFMSSNACGNAEPKTAAQLGVFNFHLVMVVNVGDSTLCQTSDDVPWLSVSPDSGALGGGASAVSSVGIDAVDLVTGNYSANICVASNDPLRPVRAVPVQVTVTPGGTPEIEVTADELAFELPPDTRDARTIEVRNIGAGILHYELGESLAAATAVAAAAPPVPAAPAVPASDRTNATLIAGSGIGGGTAIPLAQSSIAQMADNTPGDAGVSCGYDQMSTADNSWWRRFYFNEYPQVGNSVSISGVTISSGASGPDGVPVLIRVYTIPHSTPVDTIPTGALTLIGSGSGTIDSGLVTATIPVTGVVDDTASNDLVVEWHLEGVGGGLFTPGANPTAETHPTFLSSRTCSIDQPTPTSALNLTNFHLVMVVNVDTGGSNDPGCGNVRDVPWLTVSPLGGELEGGQSAQAVIGVNTLGLATGDYSANICVLSDDPEHPVVTLPISMTVTQPLPAIEVAPGAIDFTVQAGDSASTSLMVRNAGGQTLEYAIGEAGPRGSAGRSDGDFPPAVIPVSQMQDNSAGATGMSCTSLDGTVTRDNSWWRRFYFNEHPEVGGIASVRSVTISSGLFGANNVPVTVNLYTLPHATAADTIPTSQLVLIGSGTGTIDSGFKTVEVPVAAVIDDTVAKDLVVEYHVAGADGQFIAGANASAETHPTFFTSTDCFTPVPVPVANMGYADFHMAMIVNVDGGGPDCGIPAEVPWLDMAPASGSLTAGQSADTVVSVAADGLAVGKYAASICVDSNDPLQPLIMVPVRLAVEEATCVESDTVFCNGFEVEPGAKREGAQGDSVIRGAAGVTRTADRGP